MRSYNMISVLLGTILTGIGLRYDMMKTRADRRVHRRARNDVIQLAQRPTFTSDKPFSKRAKRRMSGKHG